MQLLSLSLFLSPPVCIQADLMFYFDLRPYRLKVRYAQVRSKYGTARTQIWHKYWPREQIWHHGTCPASAHTREGGLVSREDKRTVLYMDAVGFERCANISDVIGKHGRCWTVIWGGKCKEKMPKIFTLDFAPNFKQPNFKLPTKSLSWFISHAKFWLLITDQLCVCMHSTSKAGQVRSIVDL